MTWDRIRRWRPTAAHEKWTIAGAVLVFAIGGHAFVVAPIKDAMQRLDRDIAQKQADLHSMVRLRQEYARFKAGLNQLEGRLLSGHGETSVLGMAEDLAARLGVADRIVHMRPQPDMLADGFRESSAELKVEGLRLQEALQLLASLDEAPYLIRVRHMHLKARLPDADRFELTLTISTYEPIPIARRAGTTRNGF